MVLIIILITQLLGKVLQDKILLFPTQNIFGDNALAIFLHIEHIGPLIRFYLCIACPKSLPALPACLQGIKSDLF